LKGYKSILQNLDSALLRILTGQVWKIGYFVWHAHGLCHPHMPHSTIHFCLKNFLLKLKENRGII